MSWQDGREPPEPLVCPECDGTGQVIDYIDEFVEVECLRCSGTGLFVPDEREEDHDG